MKKLVLLVLSLLFSVSLYSQHLTGYYISEPQVDGYDHFKIHHYHKLLELKAYVNGKEIWRSMADHITGEKADYFIENYADGKNIESVHFVNTLMDGLEWQFFLLAYVDGDGKNAYIVVEQIFTDETETELLEINTFRWFHKHHKAN